ncbi:MAG: hypothetical protein PHG87_07390 [Candidatus Omnitrophica bacterium]|nr:hypothetical protein [Candidatus Omnitrophota bacterium]
MSVISGLNACVDGINTMGKWTVELSNEVKSWLASNSKRAPGYLPGNFDWSGSYEAWGYQPLKMPTNEFTFTGSVDGAKGVSGDVVVDSVEITIGVEAADIIKHTVEFSGNGALTKADISAISDVESPEAFTSLGLKAYLGDIAESPLYSELSDVRTVTLRFTADNKEYNSSGTSGYTKRLAGNIGGEVTISVYADSLDDLPDEGDLAALKVMVTDTLFWELKWIIFASIGDFAADVETGDLIGAELSGNFSGLAFDGSSWLEGEIVRPDSSIWWPFT